MDLGSSIALGFGLAMDVFAVSIGRGLATRRLVWSQVLVAALLFALFQAGMPIIGWLLGSAFSWAIEPIGHWVAFALLGIIGAKMIWDAFHEEKIEDALESESERMDAKVKAVGKTKDVIELLVLAVATSIDACVAGITFPMANIDIVQAICCIGIITFAMSALGSIIGNRFGTAYQRPATILGGIILISLGVKMVLEHFGIL